MSAKTSKIDRKLDDLFKFIEDHDNQDLVGIEWEENIKEAVSQFNSDYNTRYRAEIAIKWYIQWQKDKIDK